MCTLSGWGQTVGNVAQPSKKLRYIDYPTASHRDCLLDQNVVLKPWQLCVGRPYGDYVGACHGDSGSPMVYPTATTNPNPRLIAFPYGGVQNCPSALHFRIFASVPALYDWIVEQIGCSLPGSKILYLSFHLMVSLSCDTHFVIILCHRKKKFNTKSINNWILLQLSFLVCLLQKINKKEHSIKFNQMNHQHL